MTQAHTLAFIGFGEAAQAFCGGWGAAPPARVTAYDRKTDGIETAETAWRDFARFNVTGARTSAEAVSHAAIVISVVTADQALHAARAAGPQLTPGTWFFDFNSVAPDTKREAAELIETAGGRYVDVAVMAPVHPAQLATPLLISGQHASDGKACLVGLGFNARVVEGGIGAASAIKMIRSVMIKGLEALTAECVLSAYAAGVEDELFASLDRSFPSWGWRARADYNLDRMMVHGCRRAEEMKQVRATTDGLGQTGAMADAAASWQARIGDLALSPPDGLDAKVEAILRATGNNQ